MAAVARDERGMFLGASMMVIEGITEPELAEVQACLVEGLALASDLMLQKFRLASDCLNVVRSLQGAGMGPYGHVVQEIVAGVRGFTETQIVHEHRESNGDAHSLAKSSMYESLGRYVWFLYPPDGVCTSLNLND